jgi:NADH:ubiquinone oxidoreductase subunit H
MRAAAQLISYEIAQGLALVGVVMMAGTLSLTEIVHYQEDNLWMIVPQFVGFVIFLVAGFAETNRPAVRPAGGRRRARAGLHHGVRRRRFAAFFAASTSTSSSSRLTTTLFLGGWNIPFVDPPTWVDPIVVLGQDARARVLLHLGARDAAAPALRPADGAGLEGLPARRDAECPCHSDPGGGHLMPYDPGPT